MQILATDSSRSMIELAQKNNPTIVCKQLDARNINKLAEKYDGIIAGFILPYLMDSNCELYLKDWAHLLNENGILYLSFIAGKSENSTFIKGSTGDAMYFNYLSFLKRQFFLV